MLSNQEALRIVRELVKADNGRILFGTHIKERMAKRGVTSKQIMTVLGSAHNSITEEPYLTERGSYKFNVLGRAAGDTIEIVVALWNPDDDPNAFLMTVMIE